jgi:heme oxygenase-like protein
MRPSASTAVENLTGLSSNAADAAGGVRKGVRAAYHGLVVGRRWSGEQAFDGPLPGEWAFDEPLASDGGAAAFEGGERDAGSGGLAFGPFDNLEAFWAALLSVRDEEAGDEGGGGVGAERVLLGYAPTALLEGAWLAGSVGVRWAHAELGAACIEAFFFECGEGDAGAHQGNLYRAALAARGLALPEVSSPGFVDDARLCDEDFAPALVGLRLGRSSGGVRLPEIVGFHAAATLLGPPAVVRAAGEGQGRYFRAHERGAPAARRASELARRCLDAYAAEGEPSWARVARGAAAHLRARRAWVASLRPPSVPSAWEAMIALVVAKAPHAFGYHAAVRLAGRPLDAWFDPAGFDARALLAALARSPFIMPGRPDESALVTRAVGFGGPMFGAFTEAEIEVVRAWIRALAEAPLPPPPPGAPGIATGGGAVGRVDGVTALSGRNEAPARLPLPQLYHRLLNPERGPGAEGLAEAHVARLLARARRAGGSRRLAARGLWPWSAERFGAWVEARLREQVFEGTPGQGEGGLAGVLKREDLVWMLTQLAPAALVDGAWLQGAASPARFHTPVSALLFRIYRDELGAGVPRQHHGNVLRRALAGQGVELPPCDSPAFAAWPGFVPEAFSLPALWLAMAMRGDAVLPELLGLNLAIEMAGLGSTYARAVALLRRHGIDPYFFELHNAIDNPASGHTAWSVRAIELFMNDLVARGDAAAVGQAWSRLWQGYAAYEVASGPLVRAVALRVGPRLAGRWARRLGVGLAGRWARRLGAGLAGRWARRLVGPASGGGG